MEVGAVRGGRLDQGGEQRDRPVVVVRDLDDAGELRVVDVGGGGDLPEGAARADAVAVAVAVDPGQDVGVALQEGDDLLAAVPLVARGGGVGGHVVHAPARVVAEDQRVFVPVLAQGAVQPVELGGAQRALVVAAGVGGVDADADDLVRDPEAVVERAGVEVGAGVAVADGSAPGVCRIEVGGHVLTRRQRHPARVCGDGAHLLLVRLEHGLYALALGVGASGLALHEPLGLGGRDVLQLAVADADVGDEGAGRGVAAAGEQVVVAEGGVPGDVEARTGDLAADGVEVAGDPRVAQRLVLVAQVAVGVPVEREAAVLNALVVARVAGVGVHPAAAEGGEEPLHLDLGVFVAVVARGDHECERGTGGRPPAHLVDPLHQGDHAGQGEGLVRAPAAGLAGAEELVAQRVLHIRQVQVGELHEGGQRGAPVLAAALRLGQLGPDLPGPARAVAQAPVAAAAAGRGDGHQGGAGPGGGLRGSRRGGGGRGRLGCRGGRRLLRRGGGRAAVGAHQAQPGGRGDGARGGQEGTAVEVRVCGSAGSAVHGGLPECEREGKRDGGRAAGFVNEDRWQRE